MKMQLCSWLSFSEMQICGCPSYKWDLVGLSTKKNEKKNLFQFFKRGLSRQEKNYLGGGVD